MEKEVVEIGDALQKSIASAEVVQDEMAKTLTEIASAIQALNAIYRLGENLGQNAVSDQSKNSTTDGSIRDRSSDDFKNAETLSTDALYGSIRDRSSDDSKNSETSSTYAAARLIQDPSPEWPKKRVLTGSIRFDDTIPIETASLPLDSQLDKIDKLFDGLVNSPKSQKQVKRRTSIPFLKKGSIRQTLKKITSRGKLDIHFAGSDAHAKEDDAKGI